MTQPVRTGVIGVGNMGQHHARIYASSPGSVLVGVADTNLQRAEEIASRYGVEAFTDYRDLLARVEAVSIAAPTTLHHRIGLDCLAQRHPPADGKAAGRVCDRGHRTGRRRPIVRV